MERVIRQMIARSCKYAKKRKRDIFIHKSSGREGVNVFELNPSTHEGRQKLDQFLTPVKRHYSFSGLGLPEEPNAVSWHEINLPGYKRFFLFLGMCLTLVMKASSLKNRLYRLMGMQIGKNTEIMFSAWVDHFRPELIFIGENTLIGGFCKIGVHAYDGRGKFTIAVTEIGSNCNIEGASMLGGIKIEDDVRIMPHTNVSPYLARIRKGAVVGYDAPKVVLPAGHVEKK